MAETFKQLKKSEDSTGSVLSIGVGSSTKGATSAKRTAQSGGSLSVRGEEMMQIDDEEEPLQAHI